MAGTWGGGSSWGSGSGSSPFLSQSFLNPPKSHSREHGAGGLLNHLLTDIRQAAYGLPGAGKELGTSFWKLGHGDTSGFGKMGHEMIQSYKYTYGSGNFHTIMSRIYEHPLGPVLDAVSLATLPFAGLGAGVKAVDIAMEAGSVGSRGALRLSVRAAADRFRPGVEGITQRRIEVPGAPMDVYKRYSPNPLKRTFQKGVTERFGNRLATEFPGLFGEKGSVRRLGDYGYAQRQIEMGRSRRAAATQAVGARQGKAVAKLHKMGMAPEDISGVLGPHVYDTMEATAEHIRPSKLIFKLDKKTGLPKGKAKLQQGFTYQIAREHFKPPKLSEVSPDHLEGYFNQMGKALTTHDVTKAARDEEGNYLIVRQKTREDMVRAGVDTSKALYHFYTNPTKVWKWLILGTSPRYFVNNLFGNSLMLAMSANPVTTVRGMYHTTRQLAGEKAAQRSMSEVDRAVHRLTGDSIDRLLNTSSFATDIGNQLYSAKTRAGRALARGPLYGVTHYWSDTILRRIAVNGMVKRDPAYRDAYMMARQSGLAGGKAHDAAVGAVLSDPGSRELMYRNLDNILGQYHHYNRAERAVKTAVPFYGWYRAIMRHAWAVSSKNPELVSAYVRAGEGSSDDLQNLLGGHLPDFLLTSVPLAKAVPGLDRVKVLNTTGLNPYSTIPQVTDAAGAVLGVPGARPGEDVSALSNPVVTGAVEWATGTSLLTGAPIKRQPGGLAGNVGRTLTEQTPGVALIKSAINGPRQPKPGQTLLYKGDTKQYLSSFLGFPQREVSLSKASEIYNRQEHITTPKVKFVNTGASKRVGWKTAKGYKVRKTTVRKYSVRKPSVRSHHSTMHRITLPGLHKRRKKHLLPKINFAKVHHARLHI